LLTFDAGYKLVNYAYLVSIHREQKKDEFLMHKLDHQQRQPQHKHWLALAAGVAAVAMYWWACSQAKNKVVPVGLIEPVDDFDAERFAGDWYEIARIERALGKPLTRSRVEYELLSDGSLGIINRGFHAGTHRWVESHGIARFVGAPHFGAMKASFKGPFHEGYHVVAIDPDYRWAMLMGDTTDSFKLLSRQPVLDGKTTDRLVHQAALMGVEAARIHWVMQDGTNPTGHW
jgi:apolipoprotein D and lipocalin family protein